jgi:hypothetical protein
VERARGQHTGAARAGAGAAGVLRGGAWRLRVWQPPRRCRVCRAAEWLVCTARCLRRRVYNSEWGRVCCNGPPRGRPACQLVRATCLAMAKSSTACDAHLMQSRGCCRRVNAAAVSTSTTATMTHAHARSQSTHTHTHHPEALLPSRASCSARGGRCRWKSVTD